MRRVLIIVVAGVLAILAAGMAQAADSYYSFGDGQGKVRAIHERVYTNSPPYEVRQVAFAYTDCFKSDVSSYSEAFQGVLKFQAGGDAEWVDIDFVKVWRKDKITQRYDVLSVDYVDYNRSLQGTSDVVLKTEDHESWFYASPPIIHIEVSYRLFWRNHEWSNTKTWNSDDVRIDDVDVC